MLENIRKPFEKAKIYNKTKLTGLIGNPVAHSNSPRLHNGAFEALGMEDYAYLLFEITADQAEEAIHELAELGLIGINVTMPDKMIAAGVCNELTDSAKIMGSVNTIKFEDGKIKGFNTDGWGFFRALESEGCEHSGKAMTLLGAGGAARAILTEGVSSGLKRVSIFSRPGDRFSEVQDLAEHLYKANPGCDIAVTDLSKTAELAESIRYSDILVNATSVGMSSNECVISDFSGFHSKLFVADIIYKNPKTALLKAAEDRNLRTMNGIPMLFYQADLAFKIWHGVNIPGTIYLKLKKTV